MTLIIHLAPNPKNNLRLSRNRWRKAKAKLKSLKLTQMRFKLKCSRMPSQCPKFKLRRKLKREVVFRMSVDRPLNSTLCLCRFSFTMAECALALLDMRNSPTDRLRYYRLWRRCSSPVLRCRQCMQPTLKSIYLQLPLCSV